MDLKKNAGLGLTSLAHTSKPYSQGSVNEFRDPAV